MLQWLSNSVWHDVVGCLPQTALVFQARHLALSFWAVQLISFHSAFATCRFRGWAALLTSSRVTSQRVAPVSSTL